MIKRLFLFVALLASPCIFAADSSHELSALLNSVHTMRASFTQIIYDNHGKALQKSSGTMALQRPGKFRWDVKKPIPQLIIANDKRLWIYDPDLEQVTIRVLTNAAGDTPALLLSRVNVGIENEFNVETMPSKSTGWHWFKLTPRKQGNMFESVEIGFNGNHMEEMRLNDNLDHVTVVKYENIQSNQPLAASLFTFKAPANVDVIDETKKHG